MNTEYILDAIGLLDDDLIQEAETCAAPERPSYSRDWLTLAASLVVVIALGYALNGGLGMGGGSGANESQNSGAATSAPSASSAVLPEESCNGSGMGSLPQPADPGATGDAAGDWLLAFQADGAVYWATEEYIQLDPAEEDIRYTTSFLHGAQPEEDGQANFLPVGSAYVLLDNGTAAVYREDAGSWQVYRSVPPGER